MSDGNGNVIQCNKATRDLIASQNGAAVSTEALKTAQDAASKSGSAFAGVMKTLKGVLINFGIMLAIEGIIALVKFTQKTFFPTVKQLKEELSETTQEIADLHSEQENLNSELETTRQRIAELKAQGTLTFTEEAELTRLQKENAELERKLELTKANKAASKSEFEGDFLDAFNSDYGDKATFNYTGRRDFWDKLADALSEGSETRFTAEEYTNDLFASYEKALSGDKAYEHNLNKYKERINDVYEDYQGYLKQLEDADYSYGTNEQIDAYIDQINEFNDRYLVAFGNTENLFAQIVSRDKFADGYAAIKELGNVTQETLSKLYNEDTNADGTLTTLELFDQTTGECKVTSEQFSQAMSGVANELNKVEEAAEDAETSFSSIAQTLSDGLDKLSNKKDILSEVKEELDSFGAISADNISKILEQFSDNDDVQKAVAYYLSGIGTAQQVYDAMAKGYQNDLKLQAQTLATKMQNDEKYYEAIGGLDTSFTDWLSSKYGVDLENCTTLAKTKLEVERKLIEKLKADWSGYYGAQADNFEEVLRQANAAYEDQRKFGDPNSAAYKQAKANWELATQTYNDYLQMEKRLNDLSFESFNTSGFNASLTSDFDGKSGSATNEAAEKEIENLKNRHEMGLISEATYYKELEKIRKKYYAGKSQYLERDRALQEEYHDWEVRNAEDGLEDKIKSLQEQYANGKITHVKLQSELTNLINSLFKNDIDTKNKYLEELNDYLEEAEELKDEKNRETFDISYDKLKYQLENGFITEEAYYKKLDALYKKHYSDKAKYLDEYSQYSQEVYDGFKDMYKEDREADKEAWEEKKDAVSEYYDNLRKQIEDAREEEDYEKEQSEKRKEIFDLDMQIAELMREGSEKAKARIAELEEERLKAEEELLNFETDKARKDELERLEKEQETEEKKIQDKIDSIQQELEQLDKDTVSVRDAIINYAAKQGITLDFAYASGTRSSVGGFGRINEKGIEMISAPDGNGNYIPMLPNSYVFSAKATEFLWKLATEHSLPQAMYNSIAKSIKTQSSTPSVNIAQPITITMGDVIIKGNADKQTVADIKKQQENTVRMVLQKIKELQK